MATGNKKATTSKKTPAKETVKEAPVVEVAKENPEKETVKETVKEAPKKKEVKRIKIEDYENIIVQSNTFGKLTFINPRTGDKIVWPNYGETQNMTMLELKAMKGTQRAFFENQWIYILGAESDEDITEDDIYSALGVSQYYTNVLTPASFEELFTMDEETLGARLSKMSSGARMNLMVAANTAIVEGTLDSLRVIKTIENVLGCTLDRPE